MPDPLSFTTNSMAPEIVMIDGQAYEVPRITNPLLKRWQEDLVKAHLAEATKGMPEDAAAHIRLNYRPKFDIRTLLSRVSVPDDAEYVIRALFALAGVPEDLTNKVCDAADPAQLCELALRLARREPEAAPVTG